MSTASNPMTIAEFERLLDIYGSDRARWPVEARAGAGQLVARDKAARKLLAEAEALDRALERAPLPSLVREAALADRIIAAAQRSPRMVSAGALITAGASPRLDGASSPAQGAGSGRSNVVRLATARAGAPRLLRRATGAAAGLFAASLALGVFLGLAGLPQSMVPAIEAATGMTLDSGARVAQIDLLDEDLL